MSLRARCMENSSRQNEPIQVTLKVTGILEKLSVPYLIGGSFASALYGMIRTMQDSDIIT